jgi:hypothetical protein
MAGPAFVPVNIFATVRAALGHLEIMVGSVRTLKVVSVAGRI